MLNRGTESYFSLPRPTLEVSHRGVKNFWVMNEMSGVCLLPRPSRLGRMVGEGGDSAGRKARREPSYKDGGTVGVKG